MILSIIFLYPVRFSLNQYYLVFVIEAFVSYTLYDLVCLPIKEIVGEKKKIDTILFIIRIVFLVILYIVFIHFTRIFFQFNNYFGLFIGSGLILALETPITILSNLQKKTKYLQFALGFLSLAFSLFLRLTLVGES